ncbi:MAG: UDP-N-acetylmuramoyl-L-alanine--D-glutamate ligase, partial [Hyphomicrobiaceae bacterium]
DNEDSRQRALSEGLPVHDLNDAAWTDFAALVLAPGVPLTHPKPHWTVVKANEIGLEIIGDTELFCRQHEALGSKARIVAITGTNGKSTTTALTAHLLREAGRRVAMGGNIGNAVLDLAPFADDIVYVLEFSSFQLELTPSLAPSAAALLNITPDHLDRHSTLDRYARVKAMIFANQGPTDTAIVGVDDKMSRKIAARLRGMGKIVRISTKETLADGIYAEGRAVTVSEGGKAIERFDLKGIDSLRGEHNAQNAAAAVGLVRSLGLGAGEIARGLASFPGLAHRMEIVGRSARALYVNDSKATNADAAGKALASYDDIFWIAGGRAKAGGLAGLEGFWPKIAKACLIGEAAPDFAKQLGSKVPHAISGTLAAALEEAAADAEGSERPSPVVLLSPACASYDQFPNFEVRGEAFRKLVAGLKGVTAKAGETP